MDFAGCKELRESDGWTFGGYNFCPNASSLEESQVLFNSPQPALLGGGLLACIRGWNKNGQGIWLFAQDADCSLPTACQKTAGQSVVLNLSSNPALGGILEGFLGMSFGVFLESCLFSYGNS